MMNDQVEELAIIGMAGRFPRARTLDRFWQNLRDGVEAVDFFIEEEIRASGVDQAALADPSYVRARAVLEEAELFDAGLFGFTKREAEILDPQQRLFLECAWEALENAGIDSERYNGLIGIYAGATTSTYLANLYSAPGVIATQGMFQILLANDRDYLPMRVSYKLNLRGPSVNVQTSCSTSLVALHLACQSLLNGECDVALAGGVSVRFPQRAGYFYQDSGVLSPDGHCRSFDAEARGTVSGAGLGIVVLKRLSEAVADGDLIHAVIKGSAINNDGGMKIGYTAPSVDGQAEVIADALAIARVGPETISNVEAHGTATALGDPIEIAALTQAYRAGTDRKVFCAIGSVKTNIGHLDAAAGIAGLIKVVLALKNKMIPPSLHYHRSNPRIDFENSPFYVNSHLRQWEAGNTPRRAAVSSFGIGGTNAHVIVEEAPSVAPSDPAGPWQLLVISAKTEAALQRATDNLAERFEQNPQLNLADAAYTLQIGRQELAHRRVVVCREIADSVASLRSLDPTRVMTRLREGSPPPVAYMFSGQGAQYPKMGLELYRREPAFREQIDWCSEALKPHLGLDLRQALYPAEGGEEEAARLLEQTYITQPSLFVVELALAKMWMAWGVHPQAMIGHSIGEYVAACLAGVFSAEEGVALTAVRGRLMQELPGGVMLALSLSEDEAKGVLSEEVSIAAINGPSRMVASGPHGAMEDLKRRLEERSSSYKQLRTSHAFHSEMIEPIVKTFIAEMKKIRLHPPKTPYLSNVTGTWISASEATDPNYWAEHLRRTVRFSDGLGQLMKEPGRILLEVGPGQTLSALARQHPQKAAHHLVVSSLRDPRERRDDLEFSLTTLGRLWLEGVRVNWEGVHGSQRRGRLELPTYPFERERYWVEPQRQVDARKEVEMQPSSSHPVQVERQQPVNQGLFASATNSPIAEEAIDPNGAMETILSQQLQVMSLQLALLNDLPFDA